MSKTALIQTLQNYQGYDAQECSDIANTITLLNSTDHCFTRKDFPGHMIGGALLLSPCGTKTLLTHHHNLNKWLHLSGHADGETNILNVALREATEESGIDGIEVISGEIFDVDIHPVAENIKKQEPAHFHHDIRYLMRAPHMDFKISDESNDLRWFSAEETNNLDMPDFARRMIKKWKEWQDKNV